jgi:HPt (histidine-containing phosphotransfer) domain-containing protein
MPLIDQYYTKLALLTLEEQEEEFDDLLEEDNDSIQESKEEVLNARFTDLLKNVTEEKEELSFEEAIELDAKEEVTPLPIENNSIHNNTQIKEISLENVVALPISYSPQTAADELNLPVVLIEEFVDDFIEQTHQDKDHLLTSYYQKDMDNIHELGHKLKGAASNLRIVELSDILEEIQFCTEHEKLEGLFIKFWGHFLSLEDYMKQLKRS